MEKLNYLNLACGGKFHRAWINVDMVTMDPSVIQCDLLKGINFPDNSISVVYHSQFIEHLPRDKASYFIGECYRVLQPGGIIRIVTPDLENIARNYLLYLEKSLSEPNEINTANYDWLLLEMYDQSVRDSYGGKMGKVLEKENLPNEQFIAERTGLTGKMIRKCFSGQASPEVFVQPKKNLKQVIDSIFRKLRQVYLKAAVPERETQLMKKAKFRESGEIHYWLYDRFSLSRILQEAGFKNIFCKTPHDSDIPNWSIYELDVKDEAVIDPASLFMEARK